jgi:hypothetical protein
MQVSNKIYSGDYQLTVSEGFPGMILGVTYPDGQRREIGYDLTGTPNKLVDIDSTVWTRDDGSRLWQAEGRNDSWYGEIEIVPATSKDALPGTICIRRYQGNFVESESLLFPIGISLECHYTRDKTEIERHVRLLDGRKFQFKRKSRNALWFAAGGQVSHQPDNPLVFARPWNHPSLLHCLV